MARAHFVKKARKARPEVGIEVGDSYYWWAFMQGGRGGPRHYSKTRPRPSQLTRSEFWSGVYAVREGAEGQIPSFEDLECERDSIREELDNIKSETEDKYNNLPEGLQSGQPGELLQGRVDALDDCINNLDSIDCTPDIDEEQDKPELESRLARIERIQDLKNMSAGEVWGEVVGCLDDIGCE